MVLLLMRGSRALPGNSGKQLGQPLCTFVEIARRLFGLAGGLDRIDKELCFGDGRCEGGCWPREAGGKCRS